MSLPRQSRARVGHILLAGLLLLFGSMITTRNISNHYRIPSAETPTTSAVVPHAKVASSFLFEKNAIDFKPATRIIRQNCTLAVGQPLETNTFFREYTQYRHRNITELAVIQGDCDIPLAVCKLSEGHPTHFPHMMQMIYMCYSYWQANPSQVPVLYPYEKSKTIQIFESNQFLKGFMQLMKSELKVKILSEEEIQQWLKANMTSADVAPPSMESNTNDNPAYVDSTNGGAVGDNGNCTHFKMMQMKELRGYLLSHPKKLNKMAEHHFSMSEMTTSQGIIDTTLCSSPRIGFLNRKPSSRRHIENSDQLVQEISSALSTLVSLRCFEEETFEEQVRFFHSVDLLISPHGAQLTGLPFLANKPCTHLIELFPHKYLMPDFYGSLARDSGVEYSYIYVSNSSVEELTKNEAASEIEGRLVSPNLFERIGARSQNFCLDPKLIVDAARHSIRKWCECKNSVQSNVFSGV